MDSSNLSRLQLTFTIQSSSYRKEALMGVEYEVFGIISNYGDTVVHPGNAPGPCLIPKSALISLAELRNGRYVVVNHPTFWGQDVPSTHNKAVIESHTIGSWFNNYYDGVRNCIRGEIWIDPLRAAMVASADEILARLREGSLVEVSESNVCFSDPTPGELNGVHYDEILVIMVPEHIAVLPMGYIGACSNEDGCAAGINMTRKANINKVARGVPMTISQTAKWMFRGLQKKLSQQDRPEQRNQVLASDIWVLLWSALKSAEPAFYELSDYDPDKKLVFYYTRIIMGDRYDGLTELECYMRSYSITNGVVTLGDDATEVMETRTYEKVETVSQTETPGTTVPVTIQEDGTVVETETETTNETINETGNQTCGCKGETMSANDSKATPVVTPATVEPASAPATTTVNVPTPEPNPVAPASVNQTSAAATTNGDWLSTVPAEFRSVLQGMVSHETARFESLVKVAVSQGLPESAARKLSSVELVTVLEKFGIQSQAGRPVTAALTNEAGEVRQRPSPWSGSGSGSKAN